MNNCELTLEDCDIIVKKHFNTDDVITRNFALLPRETKHFELKIDIYHQKISKTVSFFAKTILNYNLQDLNLDRSLTPTLYLSKPNLAIYEDLRSQNFENQEGLLNLDQLLVVLETLASFHGANFVAEQEKECDFVRSNFDLTTSKVRSLLSSISENTKQVCKIIEDLQQKQLSSKFKRTICHGNLINKNLMFRTEKGAPIECRFLNFSSDFHASPMYDVLKLIFFNTSEDLRQHYYHTLLSHYCNCLKEETKKYDLDVSIEEFQLSAHYYLPLIKLEVAVQNQTDTTLQELKEILAYPLLSREDCYMIIKKKLKTTIYKLLSFKVNALSDVSGFLGEYYRLQIQVCHLSENQNINCFVKCPPKSGTPRAMAQDLDTFSKEVFMYETLVPQMQKCGINTITECLPSCYFQRHERSMVFEDMFLLDYRNLDTLKTLDFTLLTMLVKKLATFPACSLILEEKMSEELGKTYRLVDTYGESFKEPLLFEDEEHLGAKLFMTGIKAVPFAVDLFPEIKTETNQTNFEKFWPKLKELFYTVVKTSNRFRNVVAHGDLWTSNLLVKFRGEEPVDCVLIDFQLVRYIPPGYDLLSVLHLTTDRATRLKHEDELIKIYYEDLGRVLSSYGYSIESIYPYDDYRACLEYMKPQIVVQAATDSVLIMCTPEEISSILTDEEKCRYVYFENREKFIATMCEKSTVFKSRLRECVLDIYDYCNSMCIEPQ